MAASVLKRRRPVTRRTSDIRNWGILSRYRGVLLGGATLWIVLLHSTIWFSWPPAAYLKATGYCGVDCFLYLSAVGLYFSWKRNHDGIAAFYRRRFLRIFPAYLIIVIIRCFMEQTGKRYAVLLASTLSFWLRNDLSMWFISGITVLYLLSPLLLAALDSRHRRVWFTLFWAASLISGFLMRGTPQNLFFVRTPSFLLGLCTAQRVYEKKPVTAKEGIGMAAGFLLGTVLMILCQSGAAAAYSTLDWVLRWYSVLLFEVPLLFLAAGLTAFLTERSFTAPVQFLSGIGTISLEVYLIFELLLRFFRETPLARLPFEYRGWVYSLIILAMTILAGALVHSIAGKITGFIEKKRLQAQNN